MWLVLCLVLAVCRASWCIRCDRTPFGASAPNTPADGRFNVTVLQSTGGTYLPDQLYIVRLATTDETSTFAAFMVSAEGEVQPDPRNPRRMVSKYPGILRPHEEFPSKFSDRCHNSIEQANAAPKTVIEIYWQSPTSGNGCVTLRAMVAENEEVWYVDGDPLTQRVCEDTRQPDDIAPRVNENCQICDEAKYELTFTGMWSSNTHPQQYPENEWIPRFGELVGVSHSTSYQLWEPGMLASPGLKSLAEHANSTDLEIEIREKIGDGVRTVIKGKGHGYPELDKPTYAFVRVDKEHHLISTAVALSPSPDWFLGVTRFELCQEDNTWLSDRELNLYPWDAGTDNGVSYESPNDDTSPPDSIDHVRVGSLDKNSPFYNINLKDLNPFAKLRILLIRTYEKECEEGAGEDETEPAGGEPSEEPAPAQPEPEGPSRYRTPDLSSEGAAGGTEVPVSVVPDMEDDDCPVTQWEEWSSCFGSCGQGFQTRTRYHSINGVPYAKYSGKSQGWSGRARKPPEKCLESNLELFQTQICPGECTDDVVKSERRLAGLTSDAIHKHRRDSTERRERNRG